MVLVWFWDGFGMVLGWFWDCFVSFLYSFYIVVVSFLYIYIYIFYITKNWEESRPREARPEDSSIYIYTRDNL